MSHAAIRQIEYHLPLQRLDNDDLARDYPDWGVEKIYAKTGIRSRALAAADECSSDLAVAAAEKLFATGALERDCVDYLVFCTQSPDYYLPASACLIQHRLGLPHSVGAVDINQGCSGYIYGLGLAKGLIESGQARDVLLLTGETYSKFIHPEDRSVRTLFGDAGSATWLSGVESQRASLHSFVYGTDGGGAPHLIVERGGLRSPVSGDVGHSRRLHMNGPEVLTFTLREVPKLSARVLENAGLTISDIDLFVFHQANRFMLESVRKRVGIPPEKLFHYYEYCGNTVSSTIPIALKEAYQSGRFTGVSRLLLAGFGVGYSWAGCILDCHFCEF